MSKSRTTQILYTRRRDVTTDGELNALASIYRFLLLEKGDRHDLTSEAATQAESLIARDEEQAAKLMEVEPKGAA